MHPNGNIFSNNKLWPSEGWPEMAHQHLPSMAKQVNRSPHTKRGERKKKKAANEFSFFGTKTSVTAVAVSFSAQGAGNEKNV